MDNEAFTSDAFGRVRRQAEGAGAYYAFLPEPIPRAVELNADTVSLLADADNALGRLAGAGRLLPNPHLLVRPYMMREALASARIEGTQASISEVYEAAASGKPNPDVEEVLNYIAAMDLGLSRMDALPLTERLIKEIHAVLLAGVRGRERQPGEIRTSQNWIGSPDKPDSITDAIFVPPPPRELASCLSDWERYVHDDGLDVPVLVQCAVIHYQFETIHPFLDGNGRLGRLLIVFFLVMRDRLPSPILYLSPYFEERRSEYYERLQAVREQGDLQGWLRFFLRGVAHQANDALERAEGLLDVREQYRQRAMSETRSQAPAVVDLAFSNPILTTAVVANHLDISRQGAANILRQLEKLDILASHTPGPRNQNRWAARRVLEILEAR